jgi:malonyl-CoA decarboxylase
MREKTEADDAGDDRRILLARLTEAKSPADLKEDDALLSALTAEYLLRAKRDDGLPLDPVARFHFGNGASLEAIHPGADPSARGIAQSCGVMVNYRYDLNTVEANHELFAHRREIVTTRAIRSLVGSRKGQRMSRRTENA